MAKKILIAEDDELNRKLFVSILQDRGYEILEAVDGQEAIDIIRKESPSLVLMDIILPEMSGMEVFKTCKNEKLLDNTRVYALTAAATSEVFNAGFDGIITKPIKVKEFLETVERALEVS
ncbi:MAG: response regulator [Thermodesulfovibrionales bacterium]